MFSRSKLKKQGKSAFYRNWKSCIIICFIYTLLVGGTIIKINYQVKDYSNNVQNIKINNINNINADNNSDIVNEFIKGLNGEEKKTIP